MIIILQSEIGREKIDQEQIVRPQQIGLAEDEDWSTFFAPMVALMGNYLKNRK